LIEEHIPPRHVDFTPWEQFLAGVHIEWELLVEKMSAASAAVIETSANKSHFDQ
jgi:hypothetical protein